MSSRMKKFGQGGQRKYTLQSVGQLAIGDQHRDIAESEVAEFDRAGLQPLYQGGRPTRAHEIEVASSEAGRLAG